MSLLIRTLEAVLLAVPLGFIWIGYRYPAPTRPAKPPVPDALGQVIGEAVGAAAGLVGLAAGLCWLVVGLLVFLAPLLALAWLVAR